MQSNQISTNTPNGILISYPSPESYNMIFLTATIISLASVIFAILLNRNKGSKGKEITEREVPT